MSKASKKKARKAYSAKKKATKNKDDKRKMLLSKFTPLLQFKDGRTMSPEEMTFDDAWEYMKEKSETCEDMKSVLNYFLKEIGYALPELADPKVGSLRDDPRASGIVEKYVKLGLQCYVELLLEQGAENFAADPICDKLLKQDHIVYTFFADNNLPDEYTTTK